MSRRTIRLVLHVALVIAALVLPAQAQVACQDKPSDRVMAKCLPSPKTPLPEGVSESWWSRMQRALAEAEYNPSETNSGLQAPNRAHDLRTYFEPAGIRVQGRTAVEPVDLMHLSLVGMGRTGHLKEVPAGKVKQIGMRVEVERQGLIEWYHNSARGLEQGFTILKRPAGKEQLVLELAVKNAQASLRGVSIELSTDVGRRLSYGKLVARDGKGRTLSSRFEVPSPHRLRLVVDDTEAHYPLVIDPLLTAVPDAILESNISATVSGNPVTFGGAVAGVGDVNGDGFADVAVGASQWDGGENREGAVFVFLGSATGIVGTDPTTAHARIESNQVFAQLNAVAGAGDVNGDGYDDIVVGAHRYVDTFTDPVFGLLRTEGAAFVFHGSAAGITGTDPSTADAWIQSNMIVSLLGIRVAGAGDVNGDGFDDIMVGAPFHGSPSFPPNIPPNQGQGNPGAVLVFHGSVAGITGTGFTDADAVLTPYPPNAPTPTQQFMGTSISGGSDVDSDGYDDIVIGAPGNSDIGLPGYVLVYRGSPAGITGTDLSNADTKIVSDLSIPFIPLLDASGAGDVNGDGFDDIVVGAPDYSPNGEFGANAGLSAVFVFHGGVAGIAAGLPVIHAADAQTMIAGDQPGTNFGLIVTGAGDVDGDGFSDIAVGTLDYTGGLNQEGVGYVYRGSAMGIVGTSALDPYVRLESHQSRATVHLANTAMDIAGAGDINGDGFDDVILGFGYFDAGELDEGTVFIYHGAAAPLNPNQPPVAKAGSDLLLVDQDGNGSEAFTLDGNASFDPDGTIVSVAWLLGETLLGTSPVLTTSLPATGDHPVVLTVTDNAGLTRGDRVIVRVVPSSAPPPPPPPVTEVTLVLTVPVSVASRGDQFTVTATISNTGTATASGLTLTVSNSPSGALRLESPKNSSQSVADVLPGGSRVVSWLMRAENEGLVVSMTMTLRDSASALLANVSQDIGIGITPPAQPPTLVSISTTPANATIAQGQTKQFTATGMFSDGSTADFSSTATWVSSNPAVATINAAGMATGVSVGTTDITAAQAGLTTSLVTLNVTTPPAVGVSLSGPASVQRGQTFTVTATVINGALASDLSARLSWSPGQRTRFQNSGATQSVPATSTAMPSWTLQADKQGSVTFTVTVTNSSGTLNEQALFTMTTLK